MNPAAPLPAGASAASAAPILALHQLALYNTGRMSPEQVKAAFAARLSVYERLLADLRSETAASRPQHHLVVGQRGMGKTMLLARLAAELRTVAELTARFIPLAFAEEQYAVDRLSKFWLNCLDSLADAREFARDSAAVAALDATVARLTATPPRSIADDQPFADEVYAAFAAAVSATGQRPVLLVDNLQLVFERLTAPQQHSLRELLMRSGAPILVGASPSPPPQTQDYGAAFYDHFKVHYLRPLDEVEMRDLLLHLAAAAGRDDVRQRVLQHPARLKVLRQLTGGNPRTTLILFFLYAEDFAPTVFGDLEGLLDRVTPLYKARFEEFSAQQQVIVSAIANHWDPVTAAQLAATHAAALPTSTLSGQLDRLEKTGVIERVELFGETATGYQLAERFFNIWFLMRSASRRQRREVEFLTRFLENFYQPPERTRLARHLLGEDQFSPDRYLWSSAVAASLRDDPATAADLQRHTELIALQAAATESRRRLEELIDFKSLPPATLAFDELRQRLPALVPPGATISPVDFTRAVLGDRDIFITGRGEQLAAQPSPLGPEEIDRLMETLAKNRAADIQRYSKDAVEWFAQRLRTGQLRHRNDVEDWCRTFQQAGGPECLQMLVDSLPDGFGRYLPDATLVRIREHLVPTPSADTWRWFEWGNYLTTKLARYTEAETAYREAIARAPDFPGPWNDLGILLQVHLTRYADAEIAYREAIARDPTDALTWNNLGNLLQVNLARYGEAEAAYREAIARAPNYAPAWNNLGNLLQVNLARYAEAETAYREAIACDSAAASPWNNLGTLLKNGFSRYAEAEAAYREAIARAPTDARPWNNLGGLLQNHLGRYAEAEIAYLEAIAREPNLAWPWNSLGNLYCDFLENYEEASKAFAAAYRLDPTDECAPHNLLFLRRDFLGEGPAAQPLFASLLVQPTHKATDTLQLQHALFAAYEANWGLAREALQRALAARADGFSPHTIDDWLRASAVLLHLDFGAQLLAFLDERGDAGRLRPWVEALRALYAGDRRALQNIAPEVRDTAESIYDGIEARLKKLPASTRRWPHAPAPKKRRRRQP